MTHAASDRTGSLLRLTARVGLGMFLVGFTVFIATIFLADFRITPEVLVDLEASGVVQEPHRDALFAELRGLEGRSWSQPFTFVPAVSALLDRANQRLPDDAQIWDYQRSQYRYAIARAASDGRGPASRHTGLLSFLSLGLASLGALLHFLPRIGLTTAGIKNDHVFHSSTKNGGWIGIALGTFLIAFYILLYFTPSFMVSWIRLADPVSQLLRDMPADRWFFYGTLYTLAILVMGVRMAVQYRHSRYQLVRTASVSFFQLGFAFLIPAVLAALNRPSVDFKNAWPLNYDFFYGYNLDTYTSSSFGWFVLFWGIGLSLVLIPALAYFFGKRWYCSWVCGCGGLAETLGDPFRHLSDKSLQAWKVERWMVHGVLVFAVVMTGAVLTNYFTGFLGDLTPQIQSWYGFAIGAVFAGVVGTGFYPFMGNRVWCRFGCPLAAILGIVQRFKSRFRITTNGGQCISCGNCSTYCEMGIDVRWYAQRGQNIIRASCVGCGICSQVCPRGVLRLENGPEEGRYNEVSRVNLVEGRVDVA